ncbi:MAG: methylmalonyl-CoA mutase family protein, partial [Deltaproteobacteria bacterium]|nr:methylmalonyl-CoA mutase family protein [Deltaproteobacteria bacterium]
MTRVNQSEIKLKTFYNKADVSEFPNDPGVFPFTRGIFQDMYQVKPWTIRQYSGFGSSEATNKRYLELIQQGQEGISVAFDLPTQMGLDPDNPKCEGEVGKVGVSVATFEEFERLFMGIPLDKISVSMTINATAPILVAFLIVLA